MGGRRLKARFKVSHGTAVAWLWMAWGIICDSFEGIPNHGHLFLADTYCPSSSLVFQIFFIIQSRVFRLDPFLRKIIEIGSPLASTIDCVLFLAIMSVLAAVPVLYHISLARI